MRATTPMPVTTLGERKKELEHIDHCAVCSGKVRLLHHDRTTYLAHLSSVGAVDRNASIKILGHAAKMCRVPGCQQGEKHDGKRVVSV